MPSVFLPGQRFAPDEIALVHLDDPAQVRFPRRDGRVNLVIVESHGGLQAQRVARAQTARLDSELGARREDLLPDTRSVGGRKINLKAVLAGVAGPGDPRRRAAHHAIDKMVVANGRERNRRQLLQSIERARTLHGKLGIARSGIFNRRVELVVT